MDNLLPTLTNIDVTSDHFRETALPYQQWEAKRTYNAPTTPSDVGHLLPPIEGRKPRLDSRINPLPLPPLAEPSLPRPAPVDCNLLDLYDPALDPSPIGKEERGAVQPVRISRIVPRDVSLSANTDLKRATRPSRASACATLVTILNGYRSNRTCSDGKTAAGDDWASTPDTDEENNIDIFVEGLLRGFDHTTLLPSEAFCRALRAKSEGLPQSSPALSGDARQFWDAQERHVGLTVLLAGTSELCGATNDDLRSPPTEQSDNQNTDEGVADNRAAQSIEDNITRTIFQCDDNGKPGPSRNAFRVQFEPGPLGIELEEDPDHHGIVQVRKVLQAGQAEQDGRLSAGCLVVAVGNWDAGAAIRPPPVYSDDQGCAANAANDADSVSTFDVTGLKSMAGGGGGSPGETMHKPAIIRSLEDFEKAVSTRQPDRLFIVWALDRSAPEALAVLGRHGCEHVRSTPREWSTLYTRPRTDGVGRPPDLSSKGQRSLSPSSQSIERTSYAREDRTRQKTLEGAPGWGTGSSFARVQDSLEYSMSIDEAGVGLPDHLRDAAEDDLRIRGDHSEGDPSLSAFGSLNGVSEGEGEANTCSSRGTHRPESISRNGERNEGGFKNEGEGVKRRWEFATGRGIFNEEDQGLAARKHPARNPTIASEELPPMKVADNVLPKFPAGLHASIMDEFPVFIWFCNSHESALMKVSWMDYEGKRVPRRSLAPGACYFERSFATHPWVIHFDDCRESDPDDADQRTEKQRDEILSRGSGSPCFRKQRCHRYQSPPPPPRGADDNGDCCVVRLGDAMALAGLTGSLIWNPAGRTLSVAKQAKVGLPGMSAAARAALFADGADGAGLDPGKRRQCVAGRRREAEELRARAVRAVIREEKTRLLQEMKTCRTHPVGGVGGSEGDAGRKGERADAAANGLGQGAPHLRFVMIGSSDRSE